MGVVTLNKESLISSRWHSHPPPDNWIISTIPVINLMLIVFGEKL